MLRNCVCAIVLLPALVVSSAVLGGEGPNSDQEATSARYMALVDQLGAASYAEREQAARALRAIGVLAKPALIEGLTADDLEVRLGAHRVLVQVMQSDFERKIAAFIGGTEGAEDLPGWAQFRKQLGDSEENRRLFADMLRAENDLMAAIASGSTDLNKLLEERIQYLTSSKMIVNGRRQPVSTATLATMLFAGAVTQKASSPQEHTPVIQSISPTTSRIYSLLSYSASRESLLQGAYSSQMRQLLATWVEGIGNANEQYSWYYAMQLALRYDLSEQGPKIARRALSDPGSNLNTIPYAAFVLGRFGSKEDVKQLEPFLKEEKVFHTWSNTALKKEPIRIQIRDAVLAMMIRLEGENPAEYGFKLLQPDEITLYKVYTLGFLEDAQRDAALAKWRARQEAKKQKEQKPSAGSPQSESQADDVSRVDEQDHAATQANAAEANKPAKNSPHTPDREQNK